METLAPAAPPSPASPPLPPAQTPALRAVALGLTLETSFPGGSLAGSPLPRLTLSLLVPVVAAAAALMLVVAVGDEGLGKEM